MIGSLDAAGELPQPVVPRESRESHLVLGQRRCAVLAEQAPILRGGRHDHAVHARAVQPARLLGTGEFVREVGERRIVRAGRALLPVRQDDGVEYRADDLVGLARQLGVRVAVERHQPEARRG